MNILPDSRPEASLQFYGNRASDDNLSTLKLLEKEKKTLLYLKQAFIRPYGINFAFLTMLTTSIRYKTDKRAAWCG
jgi:hypothetical protein